MSADKPLHDPALRHLGGIQDDGHLFSVAQGRACLLYQWVTRAPGKDDVYASGNADEAMAALHAWAEGRSFLVRTEAQNLRRVILAVAA